QRDVRELPDPPRWGWETQAEWQVYCKHAARQQQSLARRRSAALVLWPAHAARPPRQQARDRATVPAGEVQAAKGAAWRFQMGSHGKVERRTAIHRPRRPGHTGRWRVETCRGVVLGPDRGKFRPGAAPLLPYLPRRYAE